MRVVPIPKDVELADFETRSVLGPPPSMESQDCDTIEVVHSKVALPSGQIVTTVKALVFASAEELDRIRNAGGHFWVSFIGHTFPPVMFDAPEPQSGGQGATDDV